MVNIRPLHKVNISKQEYKMTKQQDVFASFPWDGKLFAHFKGHFESIFITFQPFNQVVPENLHLLNGRASHADYEATLAELWENVTPVTWAEVQRLTGIDDIVRIEHAIRLRTNPDYDDKIAKQLIRDLRTKAYIIAPDADDFDPYFQIVMLKALKYLGYEQVWVSDEFDSEERLFLNIDDILSSDGICCSSNIFTPDHKILMGAIHGITSLFICASKEIIEKMKQFYPLEGFYANEKTEVEWTFSVRDFYFFDDNNQQLEVELTPQIFFEKILKIESVIT